MRAPAGDGFRRSWMPRDASKDGYEFLWVNVNKKSVVLNLRSERGIELARGLIARADVLVENYQKGAMERFGLDYDSVKNLNPRLIYACSRGYGESGPYADYGNTAQSNNAMTGWTHTSWRYSGAPGTKPLGVGDEAAGVSMAVGILAALHARERNGKGQKIVVSMQEAFLGFMISSLHEFFTGNDVGNWPTEVADGHFTLRVPDMNDAVWAKLAHVMDKDELVAAPRFATASARFCPPPPPAGSSEANWRRCANHGRGAQPAVRYGTRCATWTTSGRRFYRPPKCSKTRISKRARRSSSGIHRRQAWRRCSRPGLI